MKQVLLTGAAAMELSGGPPAKTKRRTTKKNGGSSPPAAPAAPAAAPPAAPPAAPATASLATASLAPTPLASAVETEGGAKRIRVELKKRTATKKVHLQPKKRAASTSAAASATAPAPSSKKTRKVTVGISSLHKRVSRAKKMTRKVKEMSLPQLREHLIQKKLIRPTSKAPEAVLRQMAADAQIVAGKAL